MEIMQNEASRTPGKRTSDLNHDWAALMCVRQQRAAQVNLQVAEYMCDLHSIWICVCLSEESTEKSFKSQKRWVLRQCVPSVPEHSGSFVETLNNCGVLFCDTQPHTHTRASELMWYDLPDQGTTGRHNDRRFSLTSASHLLFIVSCSLARLWTLSASQLTCHHFLQLSSNPIHASSSPSPTRLFLQSFNSCLYRSLCILPSPTIIHSLHFPHSLSSPTLVLSLLSRPPRLCSLPASLSAVWHSFVVLLVCSE